MVKKIAVLLLAAALALGVAGCAPEPDPSGISKAEYDKLELDMDKNEVDAIIYGEEPAMYQGEKISERKRDEDTYIYIYEYKGETRGKAILTFEETRFKGIDLENEFRMLLAEKQQEGLE